VRIKLNTELKAMMRVTVAGRKETFVFLYYTASPLHAYVLNEDSHKSEAIEIALIEKIVDMDIREPKIPIDILVEHLSDIDADADNDLYALVCEARITNSRTTCAETKLIQLS
jgi:hypothetical protein